VKLTRKLVEALQKAANGREIVAWDRAMALKRALGFV